MFVNLHCVVALHDSRGGMLLLQLTLVLEFVVIEGHRVTQWRFRLGWIVRSRFGPVLFAGTLHPAIRGYCPTKQIFARPEIAHHMRFDFVEVLAAV